MSRGAVLAVPACEPGRGGGHIVRCMALVRGLRALNREAWLFSPAAAANSLFTAAEFDQSWLITENGLQGISWECIILDRFQTPAEELARWMQLAPVIGIDEGGTCRNNFDFLIDVLPGCNRIKANIADPSLLPLPLLRTLPKPAANASPLKILISFGQEDAAGLGIATAKSLALAAKNNNFEITLLRGKLDEINSPTTAPRSVKIIEALPNLAKHLGKYDLVITHYGLTAFESLYAGVPVLLVSPSAYHGKLAKAAGFYSLGIGNGRAVSLSKIDRAFIAKLRNRCTVLAEKHNLNHVPQQSLADLINGFTPDLSRSCPACGAAYDAVCGGNSIGRFADRTYRRCARCGIISMNRMTPPPIEYGKEYFFEAYQKQYGKTYLEDFPNLIAMGKRRLAIIKDMLRRKTNDNAPTLLDIGCAYGPFLAAAKEEGFSPQGIDPAEDAVRYVTQTLGIPAVQGFFPHMALPPPHSARYSVITLWYVIEHFRDCVPVLAEIRKLLNDGGILAFATPSFSGISGRSSLRRFLDRSPADHWTIWSPHLCKKALKTAGFTIKKIVNSGHHPERFPLLGKYARSKKSPLYWPLLAASVVFSLGDTFEVYAISHNN